MTMNSTGISHRIRLTLGVISVFILVIFMLQNAEVVSVRFLFWTLEMSRVILILALLLAGFLLGYIVRSLHKK